MIEPVNHSIRRFFIIQLMWGFRVRKATYHSILSSHFRFYNRLNEDEQEKFLLRTFLFEQSKRFHYIGIEELPEMPVLISAVAVQLTFGLDKFRLGYFRNIFVMKDEYNYSFFSTPFDGHVDHTGIYLSWSNFMKGLMGETRNSNLGLHEMGHALTYVNFITRTEEDEHFKQEFEQFTRIARPVFESLDSMKQSLLADYARTNYQEFWASCVEVFFENPIRLRREFPELYASMKKLLRQDPLVIVNIPRQAA